MKPIDLREITLGQLRAVRAVSEEGTFRSAARKCGISQPTLSVQIQKLEEVLGAQIFDRQSRPIRLTDEGERVVAQAKAILFEVEKFTTMSADSADALAGDLHLGILPTLTPFLVPRFATKFVDQYPQINLIIHELVTEPICEKLERHELDVGFVSGPLDRPQFEERELFRENYVCYLSTGHRLLKKTRIKEADLSLAEIWLLSDGHCFRNEVLNLCHAVRDKKDPEKRIWFESGSLETIKELVDAGRGYSLFPEMVVDQIATKAERKRVRRFASPEPARTITMVNGRYFNRRKLLDVLEKQVVEALPRPRA